MAELETSVRSLLRSSEEIKVLLETLAISLSDTEATALANDLQGYEAQSKRLLAVISHKDELDDREEGSVFVLKPKYHGYPNELEVQRIFPIFGDFSITMAQSRRATIDLRASAPKAVPDQPRSGLALTISSGQGPGVEPLTLLTHDVQSLRSVLGECKRLKEESDIETDAHIAQPATTYSWLAPYTLRRNPSPILSSTPQDLRLTHRPLHTRLSHASAGLPGDDVADILLIREEWVRTKAREASRKGTNRIRLRLGTFNVNGKSPSQDLSTWVRGRPPNSGGPTSILTNAGKYTGVESNTNEPTIPPLKDVSPLSLGEIRNPFDSNAETDTQSLASTNTVISSLSTLKDISPDTNGVEADPDPDMLVLGFQELDLSTEALLYSTGPAKEDAWCMAVFAALGEKAVLYEKLASKQLVGMLLVVIVKKDLKPCFHDVKVSAAGAGIMGVMGNKGGTAVRVKYTPPRNADTDIQSPGSTTLTFVNAHLAAFDEMVDKRNLEVQDLSRRLGFDTGVPLDGVNLPARSTVYESDALFWMVHLNYRIDLPDADVRAILSSEKWDSKFATLLKYDQLRNAMRSNTAFGAFSEHPIAHFPTYRFGSGLQTDDLGYDMKRRPAWTDRVLYLFGHSLGVQQLSYSGHPEITMSDHRPVSADFSVCVDVFDKTQRDTALRSLFRQVAEMEESNERPNIKLDSTAIELGKVSYARRVTRILSVHNLGKIPCAYRFIPVDSENPVHPEWLRVEPMMGLLLPDEVASITLSAYIDNHSASVLNLRSKRLDCTVILHTALGKDHFISVTGEYEFTCFANTLSLLTRLPGPIRSLSSLDDLLPEKRAINAPREIMRLINWMMMHSINVNGLFVSPADSELVHSIRECLDTGADFPFLSESEDPKLSLAFGDTLVRLLASLTEPVVPTSLHAQCVQMTNRDDAFEALYVLPPSAINVWISVTAFLQFICQASSTNDSDAAERIAAVFAPVLLRDDPSSSYPPISPLAKQNFLLYFIG